MLPLINSDEALWASCARLTEDGSLVEALLGAPGRDVREPVLLAYGPVARRNQFQALLYSRSQAHGFAQLPLQRLDLFGRIPWNGPVVCHFHWVHDLTAKAVDLAAADAALVEWERLLQAIRANGHTIVWTVHNVLPHDTRWPDHDCRIHQMVADAADVVHVMTSASQALCSPYYTWSTDKELLIPHPSYERAQTDWISREQARASLRLSDDAFVFLSFGAMQPYKGFHRLMRVFDRLAAGADRPVRWLIAGQPSDPATVQDLRVWAHARRDVTLDIRPIPTEDLQEHFRAADVAVCPYERTLNSGAALMAASFGLPVIGPRVGGFVDNIGDDCGFLYQPGDDDALLAALRAAMTMPLLEHAQACRDLSFRLAPGRISTQFFGALRERLDNLTNAHTSFRAETF